MPEITEFPPVLTVPLNDGGRVHSIAVDPVHPNRILVANQFCGLWLSDDRGGSWRHVDSLPAIFVNDVAWAPAGNGVVASLARDNATTNGGGIWLSSRPRRTLRGKSPTPLLSTWHKPASAEPPASARVPDRRSAYGISFAPDDPMRVYVGTDYGVAVSSDDGDTWSHRMVETASKVESNKLQNAVMSILALPDNRVIALTRTGVYRSDTGGTSWRSVRDGDFVFATGNYGFKCIDVSPLDSDKVFVLQSYALLFLYEVATEKWTALPLPGGAERGPFVRVSRSPAAGTAFDIWVGAGVRLQKASCANIEAARALTATDWVALVHPEGLHEDSGYLGLDENQRPILYGCDGGLFRPTNPTATAWERAGTGATGLNSLQVTDLAGTNVRPAVGEPHMSLYFTTQDNSNWASPDGGATWPNSDAAEGWFLQVCKDAASDSEVRVAYAAYGGTSANRFSDANLLNPRSVPDLDTAGSLVSDLGRAFYVSPGRWIRHRTPAGASTEIWVSENNGNNWRKRARVALKPQGGFAVADPDASPTVYAPFADGDGRIGLIKLTHVFAPGFVDLGDDDLIYLPDNGSLGLRATEFDWSAVFGVDPANPDHIIAPDVHNQVVKVSFDGGAAWTTDTLLTQRVTRFGKLLLYDADPRRMQVTQISFDPYVTGRIVVGTREAGVVYREKWTSWETIDEPARLLYATKFFFTHGETAFASSYGRGLWKIDFRIDPGPFPLTRFCKAPCQFRSPRDPRVILVDPPFVWEDVEVVAVLDGRINGFTLSGSHLKQISVTTGSRYRRFLGQPRTAEPLDVVESEQGFGFGNLQGCLAAIKNGEVITGLVLEQGRVSGILSAQTEFRFPKGRTVTRKMQNPAEGATRQPRRRAAKPYVILSTSLAMSGEPVVGDDNVLRVFVRGLPVDPAATVTIKIDEAPVGKIRSNVRQDGTLRARLSIPSSLPKGNICWRWWRPLGTKRSSRGRPSSPPTSTRTTRKSRLRSRAEHHAPSADSDLVADSERAACESPKRGASVSSAFSVGVSSMLPQSATRPAPPARSTRLVRSRLAVRVVAKWALALRTTVPT